MFVRKVLLVLFMTAALGACGGGEQRQVIQNKGSDTLVNVAQAWAENYKEVNSNVAIAVSGGGSGTGIASMINGTVDIANASRKMKDKEIELARKNGIDPIEHTVGFDALAVYVHPDNPIEGISLEQLADIYGEGGTTKTWDQLGVEVPGCPSHEIIRISRQNNSGTYVYFKQAVLGRERDYELGSRDMHGSKDVVDLVEQFLSPVAGLGPFEQLDVPIVGTDNFDFMIEGVPNLVANQANANYASNYHAESDTFEKVDQQQARLNSAIAASNLN